jgi:transcriptional regulator with XRE-family HTH domain
MTSSISAQFGANLRKARARSGLSQMELAGRAGLSVSQVYRLETGRQDPRLPTIVNLGRALGIDGANLLRGIG